MGLIPAPPPLYSGPQRARERRYGRLEGRGVGVVRGAFTSDISPKRNECPRPNRYDGIAGTSGTQRLLSSERPRPDRIVAMQGASCHLHVQGVWRMRGYIPFFTIPQSQCLSPHSAEYRRISFTKKCRFDRCLFGYPPPLFHF